MNWIYDADELQIINFDKILFLETDSYEICVHAFYGPQEHEYITIYEGVEPQDARSWFKTFGKLLKAQKAR